MFKDIKQNCVFLSPHLDDAVLSCGGLLTALRKSQRRILVVTVFTTAQATINCLFAKRYINSCGLDEMSPIKFFSLRRKEDKAAMNFMHLKYQHLGLSDALWRLKGGHLSRLKILSMLQPYKNFLYANNQSLFSGRVKIEDQKTITRLRERLVAILNKFPAEQTTLFCTLGIGSHVDHILVRDVVRALEYQTYFWEDFPYNLRQKNSKFELQRLRLHKCFESNNYVNEKKRVIRIYHSQLNPLFGLKPIPSVKEVLYCKDEKNPK